MRIPAEQIEYIKETILSYIPEAKIYLFGYRIYNFKKGGDIDILVIGSKELTRQEKRDVKISFYKKFREQKLDITSFKNTDDSNFKNLALLEAIEV